MRNSSTINLQQELQNSEKLNKRSKHQKKRYNKSTAVAPKHREIS